MRGVGEKEKHKKGGRRETEGMEQREHLIGLGWLKLGQGRTRVLFEKSILLSMIQE